MEWIEDKLFICNLVKYYKKWDGLKIEDLEWWR